MKHINLFLIAGLLFILYACPDPEADRDRDKDEKEKKERKDKAEKKEMELKGAMEDDFFSLPALPYNAGALEPYIDWKTMKIHHQRHHKAYVRNLNDAVDENPEIEDMDIIELMHNISDFDNFVRNNGGGHFNHSLFWEIMGPDGGGEPEGELKEAIDEEFGSFDTFKRAFTGISNDVFGAGWSWLSVDEDGNLFVSNTPNQDNPLMDVVEERGTPILGLDLWEHAYYLDYQNRRQEYIEEFWNVINWPEVERRYKGAIEN